MISSKIQFFLLTTFALVCHCTSQSIPVAYNLHQNLSPSAINELGKDQRVKALLDVQVTIDEVQKLLSADSSLPRLTKGEIKDLFEKVTKEELEKSVAEGDVEKQELMKSLILALPYHSDDLDLIDNLAKSKATTKPPNVEPDVPEDFKKLLKSYGLLDNKDDLINLEPLPVLPIADDPQTSIIVNSRNRDQGLSVDEDKSTSYINPKDYEAFKPLKVEKKNGTENMEDFLKQFGLVSENSTKKSTKQPKVKNSQPTSIDSAYLTPTHSKLLGSIGISTIDNEKTKKSQSNVFRPNPSKPANDDYKRLEHLLGTIKELEKINSTTERGKKHSYSISSGPDPLKSQSARYSPLKNDVKKRQNQKDEPTKVNINLDKPLLESSLEATDDEKIEPPTTSATTTSTTEATTTEEAKKNNLEDEIEPLDEETPLPGPRRSGFYMLLDWNSFLEVGEDPDKIVVRFDPKIGDPTRFLPVTVP